MTKEEEKYTTLNTEQCKWWVNTLFSMAKSLACQTNHFNDAEEIQSARDKIIKALEQAEVNKDTDFVPVEIEFLGNKGYGYLYKPQQIIVTGYFTLEAFEHFGGTYKEKEGAEK